MDRACQSRTDDLPAFQAGRSCLLSFTNKKGSPLWEAFIFVEVDGVEPTTSCMPCKRSSQLSYTPVSKSECKGITISLTTQA
jgi:hypothetical protein